MTESQEAEMTAAGFIKHDYSITITGTIWTETTQQAKTIVANAISINIDLLQSNPAIKIAAKPNSGIVIAHDRVPDINISSSGVPH